MSRIHSFKHLSFLSIPARLRLMLVLLTTTLGILPAPAVQAVQTAPDISPEPAELVQFTAGGHVLGFQPDGVYLVGGDHVLKVTFDGATSIAPVANQPPLSDGQAQPLGRVTYPHLWEGISLTYEQAAGGIAKSSCLLDPGAKVDQIRLRYNVPVQVDAGGKLLFGFETGQMSESAPVAWQDINGQRIPVDVAFHIVPPPLSLAGRGAGGEGLVGFALGEYNPAYPLIIDPILQWHTFLGGTDYDSGNAIAVDGSGNVYVAGYSNATWGSPLNDHAGNADAFAAKLDSSGVLQWHTFLGGTGVDEGRAIAVDGSGNVYVAGYSNATWGSPVNAYAGVIDAFAARLDSNGALQWHTFMGGTSFDYGNGITVDGSGNVYVGGTSHATWGTPVNDHAGDADAFAARLDSSGALLWHTFMGSSSPETGNAIAVDGSGDVYVAGYSDDTWGAPVNAHAGDRDAFAARLNSSGALQWHTFMGGTGYDYGNGIAVDGSGDVYVAGYSDDTWGAPVNAYTGGDLTDAFAARLNSSGVLQWHTFMGGTDTDYGYAIAVDGSGNVYLAGESGATWGAPVNAHAGEDDAFAARLNSSSGALQWHTFMGSSDYYDKGNAIAVDGSSNVYLAGKSDATWGSPVRAYTSESDAFVAKMGSGIAKHAHNDRPRPGEIITYTLTVYNETFTDWADAVISDTLPTEITFAGPVTLDPPQAGATLAQDAGDLPTLASGLTITARQHITVTFPVTLSLGTENQTITNTASITSAQVLTPSHGSRSIFPTFNIRVTHSAAEADQPDVAIDSNGNVHIAYCDNYGTDTYEIWYTMLDNNGNTLIDDTLITADDDQESRRPAIVVDSSDKVHIVWHDWADDSYAEIYYTRLDPSLDDQDGDAASEAAITEVADKEISDMVSVGDCGEHPRIAIDSNDDIHVVWEGTDGGADIYYMEIDENGNELVAQQVIYSGSLWMATPDVAVDSNDNPHVTFNDGDATSEEETYYMMLNGSNGNTLIDATLITPDDGYDSKWSTIVVDYEDKVHIIWQDKRGSHHEIYHTKLDPSLDDQSGDAADESVITLIADTALTPNDGVKSNHPAIAIHRGHYIYITWYEEWEEEGPGYLHYMVIDNNGNTAFGDTSLIADKSATTTTYWTMAYLDVDANSKAHITWCDDRIGGDEVWYTAAIPIDLSITKTVDPATAEPDETITYTLAFSHAGVVTATGVVITDIVPVSVTVTSIISSGVAITDTGDSPAYVWEVADLASGAGGVITITGQLSTTLAAGDTFINTAVIATTTAVDEDTTNNSDTAAITIPLPPLTGLNIRVTDTESEADQPDVAIDSNGNVHIAYCDYYGTDTYEIWYTMLDAQGNTLIDETRITPDDDDHSRRPAIVVDSSDMVHIAWQDKSDYQVHYIKLNPSLDDQNGDAAVLGPITVVAEKALSSSDGDHPRLAIDSNDDIHIVWNDNGYDDIYYMKIDASGTELIAETLFHSGSSWRSLDIALDSNDNPHITFNDSESTDEYEAYYMMLDGSDGSTLIDATLLTPDDDEYTMRQAIEVDADDKVHIVWHDKRGSDAEIYYTKLDPALDDQSGDAADGAAITLIDDTALTPDDGIKSKLPDIAFGGGVLHVTWYESGDIHYMVLGTGGNTLVVDQTLLTTDGSVTTSTGWTLPRVNVDANGFARVVWCDDRTGNYEVWYTAAVPFGMVITKTADPATAQPGDTIAYTLVFFNAGTTLATGVVITDTVPVSVTVTSVISSGVAITDTGVSPPYVWEVADLPLGEGGVITITGQLSTTLAAGITFTNTAIITTTAVDEDTTNNSDTAAITTPPADLVVTKTVDPATANPGDPITYTLTFTNTGLGLASGVVITDIVPVSVTVTSVISSGVAITDTSASPPYVWSVANLAEGEGGVITLTGVLSSPLAAGTFTNTARIACAETEGVTSNNSDDAGVAVENVAPVADAGSDQTVNPGDTVTLDGSGSSDANGDALSYLWARTGGESVTLSNNSAISPTFTAPGAAGCITFTLTVTDVHGLPDATPDEVVITVTNVAPVADAGSDQTVNPGDTVTLDGSGSSDANGDALSYLWARTGGESVTLSANSAISPTFSAPSAAGRITFTLTVTDVHGLADATPDEVVIAVSVSNVAPVAANDGATTVEEQAITIDVLANDSDSDGNPLAVSAVTQGSNGAVTYDGGTVTYTPDAGFSGTDGFSYTVSDGSLTDTAAVTVAVVEGDRADPIDPTQGGTITIADHIQSSRFLSTTMEFPPGSVPDSTTMVFEELAYSKHNAPSGLYFAGLFFNLDAYVGADHQSAFTFTKPVTLTFYFSRLRRPSLKYWDSGGNTWSTGGITVIESSSTKMVVTINHLTEFAILAEKQTIYLPMVANNHAVAPDLVVQSVTATGDSVQVVIENQGNAPVTDEFWVDVYVNPSPAPTAVNQIWTDLADEGLVWGVTAEMQPGDVITLTVGDAYYVTEWSTVSWPLVAGTPVYAQVDSASGDTTYGAVLENHEITGGIYNNISSTVSTATVAGEPYRW